MILIKGSGLAAAGCESFRNLRTRLVRQQGSQAVLLRHAVSMPQIGETSPRLQGLPAGIKGNVRCAPRR